MKILFLPSYFKPEQAASPYLGENIREAYANDGIEMSLHVPTPTRGITDAQREEYQNRLYEEEFGGLLKIHRFHMAREKRNPIKRAWRYYRCIKKQYKYAKLEKNVDILSISSTPPINGLLASKVKKKLGCKVVYNLQDIFPDSLVNTGMTKKGSLLWKIGRKIENKTYKTADKIVVISEDFKKNIMAKGVSEEKIVLIPNWVDEGAVVSVDRKNNSLFDEYSLNRDNFYICYSGNIGLTQNMDMLVDVAKSLTDYPKIQFCIVGEGVYKKTIEQRIENEKINNIVLLPFQPYSKISEVFSLGDVGLIISKAGVGSNSVPSKTWSVMAAERPVLASFDKGSQLDHILTENECGVTVEANNQQKLGETIIDLYENQEKLASFGTNARNYIMNNLTRKIGTDRWLNVMKDVYKTK